MLISFPSCFGPWISMLMCMYFLFLHKQWMLYIHINVGQVLCVLLWLLNGLILSVLSLNLMFLRSISKLRYSTCNVCHWLASEECVGTQQYGWFRFRSLALPPFFPLARAWFLIPCSSWNTAAGGEWAESTTQLFGELSSLTCIKQHCKLDMWSCPCPLSDKCSNHWSKHGNFCAVNQEGTWFSCPCLYY
jgi:hypothetical protein